MDEIWITSLTLLVLKKLLDPTASSFRQVYTEKDLENV